MTEQTPQERLRDIRRALEALPVEHSYAVEKALLDEAIELCLQLSMHIAALSLQQRLTRLQQEHEQETQD